VLVEVSTFEVNTITQMAAATMLIRMIQRPWRDRSAGVRAARKIPRAKPIGGNAIAVM
jgi:hypothetical protein